MESAPSPIHHDLVIAYFSMEIGLDSRMPTYAGGLGILAGDTLRTGADLGISMVGVSLLYRHGYFHQNLDAHGQQTESPYNWAPESHLEKLPNQITLRLEDRLVEVGVWRYLLKGINGDNVPVYFLDTGLPQNDPYDQSLSGFLYGGDARFRLCQEAVLGLGGVAMLRALGYPQIRSYHMNEGHSALLTLALLEESLQNRDPATVGDEDREAVRRQCVFTTHTPVPAGHDQFPLSLVGQVLGKKRVDLLLAQECFRQNNLNMTNLALFFSRYVNGVAMLHGEISRSMFPNYPIDSITNGVHATTWTSPPFQYIYDSFVPNWRQDNFYLRHALIIPPEAIRKAHDLAKTRLFEEIAKRTNTRLDHETFTIGFARRTTGYKRPDLIFADMERLKQIAEGAGRFQIIFAGKAHPHDESGKSLIRFIFSAAERLKEKVPIVYLQDYDMDLAKLLCAGVDLWLNTPQRPQEASGTSGMKAALNGVPSFSVMDGWWIEGHLEGVTGWSIGNRWESESHPEEEIRSLYDKLETTILPMYYNQAEEYTRLMRSTIAYNGSFFNTQRMMLQYVIHAYSISPYGAKLS